MAVAESGLKRHSLKARSWAQPERGSLGQYRDHSRVDGRGPMKGRRIPALQASWACRQRAGPSFDPFNHSLQGLLPYSWSISYHTPSIYPRALLRSPGSWYFPATHWLGLLKHTASTCRFHGCASNSASKFLAKGRLDGSRRVMQGCKTLTSSQQLRGGFESRFLL